MADYAKLLRGGVKTIKTQTLSLQPSITLRAWIGQDIYGKQQYAAPVAYKVILVQEPNMHKLSSGQYTAAQAYAAFLEPVKPNGTVGRTEPIDPRDLITLPDGSTGPILEIKGFIDAGTNKPMFSEVWIGEQGSGALDS